MSNTPGYLIKLEHFARTIGNDVDVESWDMETRRRVIKEFSLHSTTRIESVMEDLADCVRQQREMELEENELKYGNLNEYGEVKNKPDQGD